jgi:hypothetical protein
MMNGKYFKIFVVLVTSWMILFPALVGAPVLSILNDDFETGNISKWTGSTVTSGESVNINSAGAFNGSYGAQFTTDGSSLYEGAYLYKDGFTSKELNISANIRVTQNGIKNVNESRFFFIRALAGTSDLAMIGWKRVGPDIKRGYKYLQ